MEVEMMRFSALLFAVLCATAAAGVVSTGAAQARTSHAGQWEVPRTADGRPDFQGNWTTSTLTRLERREGDGPLYTWEEVAQLEQRPVDRFISGTAPSDPNRPVPTAGGSVGTYNEIYWERGTRVAIVNGEPRTSLVTHPANGRVPARTPEAERLVQERRDFRSQFGQYDHPEMRPSGERCILFGSPSGPPMLPVGAYNSNYVIVQTADHLMIMSEMVHDARIIPIGEPSPMPKNVRPYFGNSSGRWEGDTLVVETTNISPQQSVRGGPLSEDAVVIERFTRADEETILYEFTVKDPTTFTAPWGGEIPINKLHARVYEYACHEGNYSLAGVLSGARYQERMEAEGSGDSQRD
jgi:hypothetical protein